MDLLVGIIVGVIILTFLVVVHELGHAITARRNGVVVEEFGIGFPPRAWGKKLKNNILFTINWLPLGGFVKLQGENDSASKKGDYGAATFWQKTKILLAGVMMNWLAAIVILSFLALIGLPKLFDGQYYLPNDANISKGQVEIAYVGKDSPAEKAGIKVGDKIVSFAGQDIESSDDLTKKSADEHGKNVEIAYIRNDKKSVVNAQINEKNVGNKGYFGVTTNQRTTIQSTWSAPIVGTVVTAQLTGLTLQGLGSMVGNAVSGFFMQFSPDKTTQKQAHQKLDEAGNSVAGPVGIFGILFPAANKAGIVYVLLIAAVISVSLAVMNILPIPALDGGRWFVTGLFRLMKKPLSKDLEEKIHGTGFMILIGLVILVTILDVSKFNK